MFVTKRLLSRGQMNSELAVILSYLLTTSIAFQLAIVMSRLFRHKREELLCTYTHLRTIAARTQTRAEYSENVSRNSLK